MTTVAPAPADPAQVERRRGSLVRAEVRRFVSRRFLRVLLVVALALYALMIGVMAATGFAKTTPERLAEAERARQQVVQEQEAFRQQCLRDPTLPPGVPPDEVCGPPVTADTVRVEEFLDRQPFVLVDELPGGALGLAAATSVLAFVVGATWIGAEWSTRSIVALLFWQPRRWSVMRAKIGVLVAALAVFAAASQALWWASALVLAATRGRTGPVRDGFYADLLAQQGRTVLLVVLVGLLGFALSNLTRNTGAALGVGFVYVAVVESAVRGLRPRWQEWLLTDNALALVQQGGNTLFLPGEGALDPNGGFVEGGREVVLSNLHGALVLGGVTVVLVTLGVVLFARRDLH